MSGFRGMAGLMALWLGCSGMAQAEIVGDAQAGRLKFAKCRTCHYPELGVGHNNGPALWNIFGQVAGKQEGFEYSPAFQALEFRWTPELVDIWIANPRQFVPGNMMMSVPVTDAQDRADIIEYLKRFSAADNPILDGSSTPRWLPPGESSAP